MKTTLRISALLIAGVLLLNSQVMAADGTVGATSSANSTITLDVDEVANISGVADVSQNYTGGVADMLAGDAVCVYTNDSGNDTDGSGGETATGNYRIKATTSNGKYEVQGPDTFTNDINFRLWWNITAVTTTSGINVGYDTTGYDAYNDASGARTVWNAGVCGANNAGFGIVFTADDILDKPAGLYDTVLTLIVAPDA